jgi:hypothetical protein
MRLIAPIGSGFQQLTYATHHLFGSISRCQITFASRDNTIFALVGANDSIAQFRFLCADVLQCKTLFTQGIEERAIGDQMAGMMSHMHNLRQ